jgi:hypothetical protein
VYKDFLVGLELGLSPSPFWAFFAAAFVHVFPMIACLFQHIFVFAAAERRRVAHFISEFFLAGFELGRLFFDLFFTCNWSGAERTRRAAARLAAMPFHKRRYSDTLLIADVTNLDPSDTPLMFATLTVFGLSFGKPSSLEEFCAALISDIILFLQSSSSCLRSDMDLSGGPFPSS